MKNTEKFNTVCVNESQSKPCRADETLGDTLARVSSQIYLDAFSGIDKDKAKEIALIISEVYRLPDSSYIKIDGEQKFAEAVKEVYSLLTKEHIEFVIMQNEDRKYPVKYLKAYLRTLLYNSVFEMSSKKLEDY